MAIATVNVLVPSSGDGPAANISALVGEKTVILSGTYQGSYIILASHNGANYVPVLTFDSDGRDSIRLTLPNSYAFVKVRANANVVLGGPVTVTVTGISIPGENLFATLATFLPGGGGVATFDTALLFPPTGLEADINIICLGGLAGTLLVEGSQNGVDFNPLGTFQGGPQQKSLLGIPAPLEFEPLTTSDKVRYLRLSIQGQVTSPLTVTMGGLIATPQPSSTTLSDAYDNGSSSSDQTFHLADAHGGGVVVDGTAVGFTGVNSFEILAPGGQSVTFPRTGGIKTTGSVVVDTNVAVGVPSATARLELAGVTLAPSSASLKIDPGVLMTVTESGAIESNGVHLYWTDMGGTRWQLDGGGGGGTGTLALTYAAGALAADQTMGLLDVRGGGITINGTNAGFTGADSLTISAPSAGSVLFPRLGGMSIQSTVSVAAAPGSLWNEVNLEGSTVTLTGGPATATALSMVRVGQGTVNGAGNTVSDAYNLFVETGPAGSATITRNWSAGFAGAVQGAAGLVLGVGLLPPGESDLVVGPGGTILSEASSGRLGYVAGGTQKFVISQNGGAYAPLLTSVTLAQAYGFGTVAVDQTFALLDAKGGGLVVDGTAVGFTGATALSITTTNVAAAAAQSAVAISSTFAPTGGTATFSPLQIAYTINQTGGASGAVTGIFLNATETAVVGSHRLVDLQVASASKLAVQAAGNVLHTDGLLATPAISWLTDTSGGIYHVGTGTSARMGYVINGGVVLNINQFGVGISNTAAASTGVIPTTGTALIVDTTKTLVAGAGQKWQGVFLSSSTLTLTGSANPTSVRLMEIGNPTVDAASACTIADYYNLLIGTASTINNATITRNWSLGTTGNAQFKGNVGINLTVATITNLEVVTGASSTTGNATNPGTIKITNNSVNGPNDNGGLELQYNSAGSGYGTKLYVNNGSDTSGIALRFNSPTWISALTMRQATGGVSIGPTVPGLNTAFLISVYNPVITAAAGSSWDNVRVNSSTLTINGATTPITELDYFRVLAPAITAGSAVVTTDFFTMRLDAATFSGSASATRNWTLGVNGNTKLNGGQAINGTNVNNALSPYTVLLTDYALEVRSLSGAITLNLPAITTVGNGYVYESIDSDYNCAVNNITLARSGADKINNVSGNYVQNVSGSAIKLKSNSTTLNWEII